MWVFWDKAFMPGLVSGSDQVTIPAPERRFEGGERIPMGALDAGGEAAIRGSQLLDFVDVAMFPAMLDLDHCVGQSSFKLSSDLERRLADASSKTRHDLTSPALLPAELTLSAREYRWRFFYVLSDCLLSWSEIAMHLLECELGYSTATRHSGHGLVERPEQLNKSACRRVIGYLRRSLRPETTAGLILILEYAIGPVHPGR
ncbi:hypothetical protein E4T49_02363 [Aureobasidium sp. EXF-10728]|nr:hypothetical protein E4T49_02363 [Aureobasidium sp. EXF-10728]